MRRHLSLICLIACGPVPIASEPGTPTRPGGAAPASTPAPSGPAAPVTPVVPAPSGPAPTGPTASPCPEGVTCVTSLPFTINADTHATGSKRFSRYSCAPATDESGQEHIYRITLPKGGFISAAVYDDAADVDVHILSALDSNTCLSRGNHHANANVDEGEVFIVVDSYVDHGSALEGTYRLDIGYLEPSRGSCGMQSGSMPRVNDGGTHLQMPATGPVVLEAHLVTQEEPSPYPSSSSDELAAHYALSQMSSGMVMHRSQVWAPLEGGSFYGAGIGSPSLFPVMDESYYVCMYWTSGGRPARGTRMILRKPGTDRAVVVAAGYETGPGDLSHIGGSPEEVHYYLGTTHLSTLTLGLAIDNSLPLGPRTCTD